MKFLPFEDFYIFSPLKPAEVQQRLENEVEPSKGLSFKNIFTQQSSGCYFTGYVVNGMFEIKRIIVGRNSFIPEIKGTTEVYLNGSRIHVKMRMTTFVIIFMCFWLGFAGLAGVSLLIESLEKGPFEPTILAPFGMFLFGYLLALGCFKFESWAAKNKLCEILTGTIE